MPHHRFRDNFHDSQPSLPSAGTTVCAFVPCPVLGLMWPAQQAQVQAIYRLAADRAREQLATRPRRLLEFSLN